MEIDPNLLGEVEPGLWVGGLGAVKEIRMQSERPWLVISALRQDSTLSYFAVQTIREIETSHPATTIHHIIFNIPDRVRSNLLCDHLAEILNMIDASLSEGGYCLVHCAKGISRSIAICAAFLISRRQLTLEQALKKIRLVRPQAAPNLGFVAALRALECSEGRTVEAAIQRTAKASKKGEKGGKKEGH